VDLTPVEWIQESTGTKFLLVPTWGKIQFGHSWFSWSSGTPTINDVLDVQTGEFKVDTFLPGDYWDLSKLDVDVDGICTDITQEGDVPWVEPQDTPTQQYSYHHTGNGLYYPDPILIRHTEAPSKSSFYNDNGCFRFIEQNARGNPFLWTQGSATWCILRGNWIANLRFYTITETEASAPVGMIANLAALGLLSLLALGCPPTSRKPRR